MMIFSLHGLFRGIALLAVASTISAVSLGRYAPRPAHFQILSGARYAAASGYHFSNLERFPRFLDVTTGELSKMELSHDDVVDCAICSPWQEDQGSHLIVARWNSNNPLKMTQGYGLTRFKFPSGEEVDRYDLDTVPTSRPCFFPNNPGKILFSAGDGQLYKFQFPEIARDGKTQDGTAPEPQVITWDTERPGHGRPFISEPIWPADPRFQDRLIVSLTYLDSDPLAGQRVYRRAQLWWLKLNPEATAIVEAGRILAPGPSEFDPDVNCELRSPSVTVAPNGGLVLAYLQQPNRHATYQLRLIPLHFIKGNGIPSVNSAESRMLADPCLTVAPSFSPDGKWLFAFEKPQTHQGRATRYSVEETLNRVSPIPNVVYQEPVNSRR